MILLMERTILRNCASDCICSLRKVEYADFGVVISTDIAGIVLCKVTSERGGD